MLCSVSTGLAVPHRRIFLAKPTLYILKAKNSISTSDRSQTKNFLTAWAIPTPTLF